MIAFALAGLIAAGITVDIGPETAEKALAHLTAASREKLVCSPELQREIVMVRVDDIPWSDVKARLARVCCARWRERDGAWILERPASLSEAGHRRAVAEGAKLVSAAIESRAAKIAPWSAGYLASTLAHISALAQTSYAAGRIGDSRPINDLTDSSIETPAGRAMLRILSRMDSEEIASMGPDSVAVYSDPPTAVERRLPAGSEAILKQFLAEQQDFSREIESRTDLFAPVEYLDPRFNVSSDAPPVTRLVLTFRKYGPWSPMVSLAAVDKGGWIRARAGIMLQPPVASVPNPFKDAPSLPVEFSARAKEFESIYLTNSGRFGGDLGDLAKARAVTQRWIPTLAKADQIEPMSFIIGEGLKKTADALHVELVADLPDLLLTWLPWFDSGKVSTSSFLSAIRGRQTTGSYDGHWLELMPSDPAAASESRLDRTALGTLVRRIDAKKRATIDDLAEYAAHVPGGLLFNSIDEAYAEIHRSTTGGTGASGMANVYYANVLRFWGSLSDSQRATLRRQGSLTVRDISPAARRWLAEFVYGIPRAFSTNFKSPFTLPNSNQSPRNVRDGPHEGLPNGIPAESSVNGSISMVPFLRYTRRGESQVHETAPEVLGFSMASEKAPLSGEASPLASVAYARAPMLKLTFDFGSGFTGWTEFGDDPTSWSEPMAYDKLPQDIRQAVETRYASELDNRKRADSRIRGRAIPPR